MATLCRGVIADLVVNVGLGAIMACRRCELEDKQRKRRRNQFVPDRKLGFLSGISDRNQKLMERFMSNPKGKISNVATTKYKKPERSYYWLKELVEQDELKKFGYSVEDLLDLGLNDKLTLSFVLAGRYIISGDYGFHGEVTDEPPHPEEIINSPAPIPKEYLWKILADGKASIEYIYRTEAEFSRIDCGENNSLPVVGRDQIMVTARDWDRFKEGLPADPQLPQKAEDPRIIGILAYLFAKSGNNKHHYFKSTGEVNIDSVVNEICGFLQDEHGNPISGNAYSTVQGKVSAAITKVMPFLTSKKNSLK